MSELEQPNRKMIDTLVERLLAWERVFPCDESKPEGSLYVEAADRIKELEAKLLKYEGVSVNSEDPQIKNNPADTGGGKPPRYHGVIHWTGSMALRTMPSSASNVIDCKARLAP